jgi:hypothetical protein
VILLNAGQKKDAIFVDNQQLLTYQPERFVQKKGDHNNMLLGVQGLP